MKLIGAGYARTGTMSLKDALDRLGISPTLHMIDLVREPDLADRWLPVVAGRPVDWTEVFDGFEATVDWPGCTYYRELMRAFPDAKVLLNVRDFDDWHTSMLNTLYAARKIKMAGGEIPYEGTEAPATATTWQVIDKCIWEPFAGLDFEDPAVMRQVWERHLEQVREHVPPDRLLEYWIGDGWEPLCAFLDVPVPDRRFPHHNNTAFFRQMIGLDPPMPGAAAPVGQTRVATQRRTQLKMTRQVNDRYASRMVNWLSAEEQRAWRAYRRMWLLVDTAVARDLARDAGLSMPDYLVLSTLSESAGHRRRLTDLSARMQWSASRLSHHVTRMEQRGLVTRQECSEDLRAAYVVLTEAGWQALRAAAPDHVRSVREHLIDLLTSAELAAMTSIGEKVARHFGEECLDYPDGRADSSVDSPSGDPAGRIQSENRSPVSRS